MLKSLLNNPYKKGLLYETVAIPLNGLDIHLNESYVKRLLTKAKQYKLLEVSLESIQQGEVISLDKKGEWYIMENGKVLRHTKIMFYKDAQQKKFCQAYRYHDPTKAKDGCIYVLLCINYDKDVVLAISTIRKISYKCIKKYWHDWVIVPKTVLDKLIKHLKDKNLADERTVKLLEKVRSQAQSGKKDHYLMFKDTWTNFRKRKSKKG